MEQILALFPHFTEEQIELFKKLEPLYREWNAKINVISRKDIDSLYQHHILHSLALLKVTDFKAGTHIIDLGTGGGIPGIPLAIALPQVQFTLIDGTQKKIRVVEALIEALDLKNVTAMAMRSEEYKGPKADFVICRGVAPLEQLHRWCKRLISNKQMNSLPNGLFALKGGRIKEEIKALPRGEYFEQWRISQWFPGEWFEEKAVVYVQG